MTVIETLPEKLRIHIHQKIGSALITGFMLGVLVGIFIGWRLN